MTTTTTTTVVVWAENCENGEANCARHKPVQLSSWQEFQCREWPLIEGSSWPTAFSLPSQMTMDDGFSPGKHLTATRIRQGVTRRRNLLKTGIFRNKEKPADFDVSKREIFPWPQRLQKTLRSSYLLLRLFPLVAGENREMSRIFRVFFLLSFMKWEFYCKPDHNPIK